MAPVPAAMFGDSREAGQPGSKCGRVPDHSSSVCLVQKFSCFFLRQEFVPLCSERDCGFFHYFIIFLLHYFRTLSHPI
jgi:hypothetical protein